MSSFPILDLVAGMIFIFFLLSIICSSAVEMYLTLTKIRAKLLEQWLTTTFKTKGLGKALLDHCAVNGLSEPGKSAAYMDARNFATALLDKITVDPANPASIASDLNSIVALINKNDLLSDEVKRMIVGFANEAKDTVNSVTIKTEGEILIFKGKIERWFDTSMDRITGRLKSNHTRRYTFWLGLVLVLLLNADSIEISKYLYNNPEARVKLASQAYAAAEDKDLQKQIDSINSSVNMLPSDSLNLEKLKTSLTARLAEIKKASTALQDGIPLGWKKGQLSAFFSTFDFTSFISKLIGLLGTVLAVMMGAPFWFDILNKVSNLRGAGKKPELSGSKKSK